MDRSQPTRREFVATSAGLLGSGWLWLNLPAVASLAACAKDAARNNEPFRILTAEQGATMRAFAARLIPSDDALPGAEEAGAVWFVDGALGGPFAGMKDVITAGLADLDQRARQAHNVTFADATPEQQDAIINDIVETPFFFNARLLTVAGVFSDPSHGGNRDHAGFAILGMQHAPAFQPPFGWYDEQHAKGGVA